MRGSPGSSRGLPPDPLSSSHEYDTPLLLLLARLRLFHTPQVSRRPRHRNEERGNRAAVVVFETIHAILFRGKATLWPSPLALHQAPSDLDEQRGRSGFIRGYGRSFDFLGTLRKVWWQHEAYKPVVSPLNIPLNAKHTGQTLAR